MRNARKENEIPGQKHPYHLVDASAWPLAASIAAFLLGLGAVFFMHGYGPWILLAGTGLMIVCMIGWWRDVLKESDFFHTKVVQQGLKIGMALFIASEVMFFVAFFWAYFNASLAPTEAAGGVWPPQGIETLDPFRLPYLNTLLLLLSGTAVTWAHHALLEGKNRDVVRGLGLSVLLGIIFLCVQAYEYQHATFSLSQGIYPSTFYLATGFHGFHVLVGTLFLIVCWWQARRGQVHRDQHVGFEAAAWYWHFVDVVWLFLFVSIYWLGQ